MTKKRHPNEMTDEEAEFYRRIAGGPVTVLRDRQPRPPQPKQEEEPQP